VPSVGAGRGPRLVGIVAAAAGLVACSGSSSAPTARGPVETLVPSPTTSTSPPAPSSPATQSPDSDIPADHRDIGYIVKVDRVSGTAYIRFDRILFLTGDAANKAAADHGDETPVPNDYYIVDETHRLLTFVVAANARARVITSPNVRSTVVSVAELAQIVAGRNPRHRNLMEPKAGFWIVVSPKYPSPVVELEQQYQP